MDGISIALLGAYFLLSVFMAFKCFPNMPRNRSEWLGFLWICIIGGIAFVVVFLILGVGDGIDMAKKWVRREHW